MCSTESRSVVRKSEMEEPHSIEAEAPKNFSPKSPARSKFLSRLDHFFDVGTDTRDNTEANFLSLLKEHVHSEELLRDTCELLGVTIAAFPKSFSILSLVNDILIQAEKNCELILELCTDLTFAYDLSVVRGKKKSVDTYDIIGVKMYDILLYLLR